MVEEKKPKTVEELQAIALKKMQELIKELRGPNEACMVIAIMQHMNNAIFALQVRDEADIIIAPW